MPDVLISDKRNHDDPPYKKRPPTEGVFLVAGPRIELGTS